MTKYTKQLPSSNDSKTEWNYPEKLPNLTKEQIFHIKENMDEYIEERTLLATHLKDKFLDLFTIAYKKLSVLKRCYIIIEEKIQRNEYPTDVVMLMLFEDSVKYSAITFSEISKKLILFISKELRGKYLHIVKRNSLTKIVETISQNNPSKSSEYKQRLVDYQNTWDVFFPNGTNKKNSPLIQDLENLTKKLNSVTEKLRAYRDKVAAHFDDEDIKTGTLPTLQWAELEDIVLHLQNFLIDFYFLLTHMNIQLDELDGIGFASEENTVKSIISGIFRDSSC